LTKYRKIIIIIEQRRRDDIIFCNLKQNVKNTNGNEKRCNEKQEIIRLENKEELKKY